MFLLSLVLSLLFIYLSTGDYCPQDDKKINCTLCSQTCFGDCKNYHCPEKCVKLNNCKTCENMTTEAVCGKGCIAGYAGERCQEYCPGSCKECHQYNRKCTSCVNDGEGENCDLLSTVSSTTTRRRQCAEKCGFCQGGDTMCQECDSQDNCQDICGCNGTRLTTTSKLSSTLSSTTTIPYRQNGQKMTFWVQMSVGISLTLLAVVVIGLAVVCCKLVNCRKRNRSGPEVEREMIDAPEDNQRTRRESYPYAYVAVIDRDCAPDHLIQAAMITAPQIIPNPSSDFNPYSEIQWNN